MPQALHREKLVLRIASFQELSARAPNTFSTFIFQYMSWQDPRTVQAAAGDV